MFVRIDAGEPIAGVGKLRAGLGELDLDLGRPRRGLLVLVLIGLVLLEKALVIAFPRINFSIMLAQGSLRRGCSHPGILRRDLRALKRAGEFFQLLRGGFQLLLCLRDAGGNLDGG